MAEITEAPISVLEVLEQILHHKLKADSKIGDLIADLNEDFHTRSYGPKWSFIEAALSADDEDTIVIQMVVSSKPSTFTIYFSRVKALILDTPR